MASRARRPRITLDQLHTFVAVADVEHVRQAAAALHLSQAAVSQQIALLESVLGLPLFERHGRGIRLTPAGRDLKSAAATALQAARSVEETAASHRGLERGEVTVATGNILGTHRLPGWLASFADRHPHIDFVVRFRNSESAVRDLAAGEVDCALVGAAVSEPDLEARELLHDELLLVVGSHHPLAQTARPLRELNRHRYLARGEGSGTERLARRLLGEAYGAGPVLNLGTGALQAGLLAGLGYAVMPRMAVESALADGRLTVLPLPGRSVVQQFLIVRRRGAATPALEAFWAHLVEVPLS